MDEQVYSIESSHQVKTKPIIDEVIVLNEAKVLTEGQFGYIGGRKLSFRISFEHGDMIKPFIVSYSVGLVCVRCTVADESKIDC